MCQKCLELFDKTITLIDAEVRKLSVDDAYFLASMLTRATMLTESMSVTVANYQYGRHVLCFVSLPGQNGIELPRASELGIKIRDKVTELHQSYQKDINRLHQEATERN